MWLHTHVPQSAVAVLASHILPASVLQFTKTVQQLSPQKPSAFEVVSSTLRQRGLLGLYKGLDTMVYFATPKAAIRFSAFEFASGKLRNEEGKPMFGKMTSFLAGVCAGTMEAICVTTPQETLKVKLIHDANSEKPRFRGFFHGVRTIVSESGLRGCYCGLPPTVLKTATAQATRFGIFNVIPAEYRKSRAGTAASGAFAGGVSVLAFQGIDVVKSRMQSLDAAKYNSSLHCLSETVRNEGIMALYKGVGPRLSRVCCEVAITMTLYGEVVKVLNKFWNTEGGLPAPSRNILRSSSVLTLVREPTELPATPVSK